MEPVEEIVHATIKNVFVSLFNDPEMLKAFLNDHGLMKGRTEEVLYETQISKVDDIYDASIKMLMLFDMVPSSLTATELLSEHHREYVLMNAFNLSYNIIWSLLSKSRTILNENRNGNDDEYVLRQDAIIKYLLQSFLTSDLKTVTKLVGLGFFESPTSSLKKSSASSSDSSYYSGSRQMMMDSSGGDGSSSSSSYEWDDDAFTVSTIAGVDVKELTYRDHQILRGLTIKGIRCMSSSSYSIDTALCKFSELELAYNNLTKRLNISTDIYDKQDRENIKVEAIVRFYEFIKELLTDKTTK